MLWTHSVQRVLLSMSSFEMKNVTDVYQTTVMLGLREGGFYMAYEDNILNFSFSAEERQRAHEVLQAVCGPTGDIRFDENLLNPARFGLPADFNLMLWIASIVHPDPLPVPEVSKGADVIQFPRMKR